MFNTFKKVIFLLIIVITKTFCIDTLEREIAEDYSIFLKLNNHKLSSNLCSAVHFLNYYKEQLNAVSYYKPQDLNRAYKKMAILIGRGAGVGGISNCLANEFERRDMLSAIHTIALARIGLESFQLNSIAQDNYEGDHQKIVAAAYKIGQQQFTQVDSHDYNYFKAPIFHTYNTSKPVGKRFVPFRIKLSQDDWRDLISNSLPATIKTIPNGNIDLFFVVQNINLCSENDNILFRPHYWLSPHSDQWQNNIKANFFQTFYGPTINQNFSIVDNINFHGLVSPNNFSIEHSLPKKPEIQFFRNNDSSVALWSFLQHPKTGRYALTLHWLLCWRDAQTLYEKVWKNRKNMNPLITADNLSKFSKIVEGIPGLKNLYHFAF